MPTRRVSQILGGLGALLGGAAGWYAAGFFARQGYYGLILPGGLLGLGCGLLARHRSTARGLACAVAALGISLHAEWANFPFVQDDSLRFFVAHLGWLPAWKWAFHGVGAAVAFWCGRDCFFEWGRPHPTGPR